MTKEDFNFEDWFDNLCNLVLDGCQVDFSDPDSVRYDYDEGRNVFDVADEIIAEYGDE